MNKHPDICPRCSSNKIIDQADGTVTYDCLTTVDKLNRWFWTNTCDTVREVRKELDGRIIELNAKIAKLNADANQMENCIENAWSIIANVSEGDWKKQSNDWRQVTMQWRDQLCSPIMSRIYERRTAAASNKPS